MDEEDGRPGPHTPHHGTRKFGPLSAATGALPQSLRKRNKPAKGTGLKGTGFSPYESSAEKIGALASEGMRTQIGHRVPFPPVWPAPPLSISIPLNPTSIPAPFFWRGPAEGICPAAGGGAFQ